MGGLSYSSTLLFGSEKIPADLIYDTGSGYLTVTGSGCSNCGTKIYDSPNSNTSDSTGSFKLTLDV